MSGEYHFIEIGIDVLHDGVVKTVEDYYFISQFGHNNDLIIVQFTDGTDTGYEGFSKLDPIEETEED